MNKACVFFLFLLPGISVIVLAVLLGWVVFPHVIQGKIVETVRLADGSDTWNKWKDPQIPIYLTFYIHHVTNPDQVEGGEKPIFEEKGPYAYKQRRRKVEISQSNGLNTVRYREHKTFYFDQKASGNNTEDDLVNVPNVPFIGVIHTVRKQLPIDFVVGIIGNIILFQEPLIKRDVRVGDLLFEGFDVTKYTNSLLRSRLPKEFSGGRFGLYKGKNGSLSELWEVYTGQESPMDFGRVRSWDGKTELGVWQKHSACDMIKGTDGSIFHPFLTRESKLDAFSPDVCKSLTLEYKKDMEFRGIQGYRFGASDKGFEDPRVNPDNRCLCLEEDIEKCPHAGVLPMEKCLNAPLWSSSPYFLNGDIRYITESGSPYPDRELHQTFIDIEPTTGLLLRAHKRLQMNLEIRHERKVRALQKLKQDVILFPLFWVDESAEIDDAVASDLKSKLITPLMILNIVKWVLIGIGVLLLFLGGFFFTGKHLAQSTALHFSQVTSGGKRRSVGETGGGGGGGGSRRLGGGSRNRRVSNSSPAKRINKSSSTSISSIE